MHILVVGLGKSGISAVNFCLQQGARVSVSDSSITDSNDHRIKELLRQGVYCELGNHSVELFTTVDLILVSPGVPTGLEVLVAAKEKGVPIIGELALAPGYLKTKVIAITGTNGKTTVTSLIGDLLKGAGYKVFVGGNIGTPLTDYLVGEQKADWLVLEVSSFQLDTAGDFRPDIGVLLNISADHLDRYQSYAEYVQSKLSLFSHQQVGDVAIVNSDDSDSMRSFDDTKSIWHGRAARECLSFGSSLIGQSGSIVTGSMVKLSDEELDFDQEEYDLRGTQLGFSPNLENAAVAILVARVAGCNPNTIKNGLDHFSLLRHRMTMVAEVGGVRYYNDSKATNIGAVCSALGGLAGPVVLIAGGRDKGGDYRLLADLVSQKVKVLLLIGEAKEIIAESLAGLTQVETLNSMSDAVERASQLSEKGDSVLLSPACASFDMFSGYSQRGEVFEKLVATLQ